MKIEHIGFWTKDIENMRAFYEKYFGASSNELYHNPKKHFSSYFLTFDDGSRLELMSRPDVNEAVGEVLGYAHLALSLGSKEQVDEMTDRFKADGFEVLDGPRTTGDGYYESVILDPEGNRIELTV